METTGEASIEVRATPEAVYRLLIDLDRIGELSPECHRAEWLDGVTAPHAGARFVGHNRVGDAEWQTECRVLRAMPGDEWAFKANVASATPTTWRYRLRRTDGGCTVTVRWEAPVLGTPEAAERMPGRDAQLAANVARSLQNLARSVEG